MPPHRPPPRRLSLREDLLPCFPSRSGEDLEAAGMNVVRIEREIDEILRWLERNDISPGAVRQKAESDILHGAKVSRGNVERWLAAIDASES